MRRIMAMAVAGVVLVTLSGCFPPLPGRVEPGRVEPGRVEPTPDHTGGDGSVDWAALPLCPEATDGEPWVLVDDFPIAPLETAGVLPACGATYAHLDDLPPYTSIADPAVTLDELEALAAALEAGGFALADDTFEPVGAEATPGLVGSWVYQRDAGSPTGDTVIYIVNFWPGSSPDSYYTYVDHESPLTRVLG